MPARIQIDMLGDGQLVDLFHPDLTVACVMQSFDLDMDTMAREGDNYIFDFQVPNDVVMPLLYTVPCKPHEVAPVFSNTGGNNWRLTMYPQIMNGLYDYPVLYGTGIATITYKKFKLYVGGYRG